MISPSTTRATLLSALAIAFLVHCGSAANAPVVDGPDAQSPAIDAGVRDAPSPRRDHVRDLTATTDRPEDVRLSWKAPADARELTGYRILRDGKPLGQTPVSTTSYEDKTAAAPGLLPPKASASDGTRETVLLTWVPVAEGGGPAVYAYTVEALYGNESSAPSSAAAGGRTGTLTGYDVSRDDGATWIVVPGLKTSYEDQAAPRVPVVFPAPLVTPDDPRSLVRLELPTHPTAGTANAVTYRVRARIQTRISAPSLPTIGRRGPGHLDAIRVQWQRSAGPTDAAYADLPNVTGRVWIDTTAPTDAARFFRARTDAPWAEGVSTAASARAMAWKRISAAENRTCGIRASDDTIACWGQAPLAPTPAGTFKELSITQSGGCAIRLTDDTAVCWGIGAPSDPIPDTYTTLDASGDATGCGIRKTDGRVRCWDRNGTILVTAESYTAIANTGYFKECGVRKIDGHIACWVVSSAFTLNEEEVSSESFRTIAANQIASCGIRASDNRMVCWDIRFDSRTIPNVGYASLSFGRQSECAVRLADHTLDCFGGHGPSSPTEEAVEQVGAGAYHVCALIAGRARCWGRNGYGEAPGVPRSDAFSSLALGARAGVGVRALEGKFVGWGYNYWGGFPYTPSVETFRSVALGTTFTCGIRTADGKVTCQGWNNSGEAPPGPSADAFDALVTNGAKTCGIRSSDKRVACWGDPESPMPNGLTTESVAQMDIGANRLCSVLTTGRLKCWGDFASFYEVPNENTDLYSSVVVGADWECALRRTTSKPKCWSRGQDTPFVPDVAFKSLASFHYYGYRCGIRTSDDHLECWTSNGPAGEPIPDPVRAVTFATGACAIRLSDDKMICWGPDTNGEAPRP